MLSFVAVACGTAEPPLPREEVAARLRAMVAEDQAARRAGMTSDDAALASRIEEIDHRNTDALQALVRSQGWITRSAFGEEASHDAWLLVQHADHDRAFQRAVLARMEPLVAPGEVSAQDYGYLWDRVAVAEGRPQRYGTQGRCADGAWVEFAVEDPARLDGRRAAIGLWPMEQYRALFGCTPPGTSAFDPWAEDDSPRCEGD